MPVLTVMHREAEWGGCAAPLCSAILHGNRILLLVSCIISSPCVWADQESQTLTIAGESFHQVRDCTKQIQAPEPQQKPAVEPSASHARTAIDNACLSNVDEVRKEVMSGNALLLDVRTPEAFRGIHIPNSLNLPLYEIKYKSSLINRRIILVNKGTAQRSLMQTCMQLRSKGFKQVSIMQGGLKSWIEHGYFVNGNQKPLAGLSELTPYELVNAAAEREWVFIVMDPGLREISSIANIIDYHGDFQALIDQMDRARALGEVGKYIGFVVASRNGNGYEVLRKRFSDYAIKDIYYLSGGVDELQHYKQKLTAQLERLQQGFQEKIRCGG